MNMKLVDQNIVLIDSFYFWPTFFTVYNIIGRKMFLRPNFYQKKIGVKCFLRPNFYQKKLA